MNAYLTYVCSDNFIPGVVALYNSVRLSNCNNDFIVLVTDDVSQESRDILNKKNLKIVDADKIYYNGQHKDKILDRYGKVDQSWKMFTKINIWKQVEYSKIIYLDADTLVLNNIDELFDVEELGAVIGGSVMLNYSGIEAGVLVVKPDINTYNNIIDALKSDTYDIKMSDQSFLNDYFSKHGIINAIPEIYNRMWKKNRNPGGASIFHFNGSKPWIDRSSIDKNTFDLWSYFYEYDNN